MGCLLNTLDTGTNPTLTITKVNNVEIKTYVFLTVFIFLFFIKTQMYT